MRTLRLVGTDLRVVRIQRGPPGRRTLPNFSTYPFPRHASGMTNKTVAYERRGPIIRVT